MECWATATGGISLITTKTREQIPVEDEPPDATLEDAIRDYVRTYVRWHGRAKAAETFGVSRHTLWRYLEQGRLGKSLPRAVIKAVGGDPEAIDAAAWAMTASRQIQHRVAARPKPLAEPLEDALRLLCASPLATVEELSALGRVPATTLRRRLAKLAETGLVESVAHHLGALGAEPLAPPLSHRKRHRGRSAGRTRRSTVPQRVPGVPGMVPAPDRTPGRRGRSLPRVRDNRPRRPPAAARAGWTITVRGPTTC